MRHGKIDWEEERKGGGRGQSIFLTCMKHFMDSRVMMVEGVEQ